MGWIACLETRILAVALHQFAERALIVVLRHDVCSRRQVSAMTFRTDDHRKACFPCDPTPCRARDEVEGPGEADPRRAVTGCGVMTVSAAKRDARLNPGGIQPQEKRNHDGRFDTARQICGVIRKKPIVLFMLHTP